MRTVIITFRLDMDLKVESLCPTLVPWSACSLPGNHWSAEDPTRFILSRDAAVRIRLGASFSSNDTGLRQAWISKNLITSEPFLGYPTPCVRAVGDGSSTSFSSTSALINHSRGDTFEMWVYQNSGRTLSLRGANATWLEFELQFRDAYA